MIFIAENGSYVVYRNRDLLVQAIDEHTVHELIRIVEENSGRLYNIMWQTTGLYRKYRCAVYGACKHVLRQEEGCSRSAGSKRRPVFEDRYL